MERLSRSIRGLVPLARLALGELVLSELVLKRGLELWLRSPERGFDYEPHPAVLDDQPSELVTPRWLLKYAPANAGVLDAGAPGQADGPF